MLLMVTEIVSVGYIGTHHMARDIWATHCAREERFGAWKTALFIPKSFKDQMECDNGYLRDAF